MTTSIAGEPHTGAMYPRPNPRAWSLARQLFALQVVVVTVVVLASGAAAYLEARQRSQASTAERVLAIARSVAASPFVRSALTGPVAARPKVLEPYSEEVRRDTSTDFVVVMDTHGIRYSHPAPRLISGFTRQAPRAAHPPCRFFNPSLSYVTPVLALGTIYR